MILYIKIYASYMQHLKFTAEITALQALIK